MWAVIVQGTRSEWIHWPSIDRTRRDCWQKYKQYSYLPEYQYKAEKERRQKKVRLAKVRVEEVTKLKMDHY